jgi:hypothetical protein
MTAAGMLRFLQKSSPWRDLPNGSSLKVTTNNGWSRGKVVQSHGPSVNRRRFAHTVVEDALTAATLGSTATSQDQTFKFGLAPVFWFQIYISGHAAWCEHCPDLTCSDIGNIRLRQLDKIGGLPNSMGLVESYGGDLFKHANAKTARGQPHALPRIPFAKQLDAILTGNHPVQLTAWSPMS